MSFWLFQYGELIKAFTLSNLKVRYKNSVLGFAWSMLNPLLMMAVFLIVFTVIFPLGKEIQYYPIFLLLGITFWRFFSVGTSAALRSVVDKSNLVRKVYFPREIIVLSSILAIFIGTILEFIVFFVFFLIFNVPLQILLLLFPIFLLIEFGIVFGLGMFLSTIYVKYRDMDHIWEVIMQIGFFFSPIFYSVEKIAESAPRLFNYYILNPLAGIISGGRDVILYGKIPDWRFLAFPLLICLLALGIGYWTFKRAEPNFAVEV